MLYHKQKTQRLSHTNYILLTIPKLVVVQCVKPLFTNLMTQWVWRSIPSSSMFRTWKMLTFRSVLKTCQDRSYGLVKSVVGLLTGVKSNNLGERKYSIILIFSIFEKDVARPFMWTWMWWLWKGIWNINRPCWSWPNWNWKKYCPCSWRLECQVNYEGLILHSSIRLCPLFLCSAFR